MEQSKILPITDLGNKMIEYYKSLDCKYFVINVEDFVKSLSDINITFFLRMLDSYNKYREDNNKEIHTYYCLDRREFPEFKDKSALEFIEWVKSVYNYAYGKEGTDKTGEA